MPPQISAALAPLPYIDAAATPAYLRLLITPLRAELLRRQMLY